MVQLKISGADPKAKGQGLDPLSSFSHYFTGSDPGAWRTSVAHFSRVQYRSIYPDIDMVYHGSGENLEFDFELGSYADPDLIAMEVVGAGNIRIDSRGDLRIETTHGVLLQHKPFAYQDCGGKRHPVTVRYRLTAKNRFPLGRYDRSKPLVIDPVLTYSTFLGGSQEDHAFSAVSMPTETSM